VKRRNFLKHQSAKQYKRRRFNNPYFTYRNAVPRSVFIVTLLAIFLPAVLLLWIFLSPSWRIQDIQVIGLTTISLERVTDLVEEDIRGDRFFIFPKSHRLFLQDELLILHLKQEFDFTEVSLETKKQQILITVEETVSELVFVQGETASLMMLDGSVNRPLTDDEQQEVSQRTGLNFAASIQETDTKVLQPTAPVLVLRNRGEGEVVETFSSIEPTFFIALDTALRARLIEPYYYELDAAQTTWVRVKTTQGTDLLFDGREDIYAQLDVLDIVIDEYQQNITESEYIDLRFGNRVYVK
jgi:hypothetical protein